MYRYLAIAGMVLFASTSMSAAQDAAPTDLTAIIEKGDLKKGAKLFKKCKACHQVGEKAKHKVGPQLNGLFDRPFAEAEGFKKYSKAFKSKKEAEPDFAWTEETLGDFLKKPKKYIKKTKMSFAGFRKDKDIVNILAYLAQYGVDGVKAE